MLLNRMTSYWTKPALCGLCLVLVACATAPEPAPKRAKFELLLDHTGDTNPDFSDVSERRDRALAVARRGDVESCAKILDAIRTAQTDDRLRDWLALDAMAVLVNDGRWDEVEGRLQSTELTEGRTRAEADLLWAVVAHVADDDASAVYYATRALRSFTTLRAHGRYVSAALDVSRMFEQAGNINRATEFMRYAYERAKLMKERWWLATVCCETGRLYRDDWAVANEKLSEGYLECVIGGFESQRQQIVTEAARLNTRHKRWDDVLAWGDRVRDRQRGVWPMPEDSGLSDDDWCALSACYLLARMALRMADVRTNRVVELLTRYFEVWTPTDVLDLTNKKKLSGTLLHEQTDK